MNEIKISVIVPVYNAEKYLVECLDSIVNQTLKEIEIILVDDESKDGSLKILEDYAKNDSRIIVINNVHTGDGAASARNAGLKIAKGKYLSFLDSDDYFDLTMLEKAYNRAEECEADIVMCDYYMFDEYTHTNQNALKILRYNELGKQEVFSSENFCDEIFLCNQVVVWSKLFKREYINELKLEFKSYARGDDVWFSMKALTFANRISIISEPLIHYRIYGMNGNTRIIKNDKKYNDILDSMLYVKNMLEKETRFIKLYNGFIQYVLQQCFFDTSTMLISKKIKLFECYFNDLQKKYFDLFEFKKYFTHNITDSINSKTLINILENGTKEEWLFEVWKIQKKKVFFIETDFIFPYNVVGKEERVILYGAGYQGTALYLQNLKGNHCHIIAWVDSNSKNMQYPIEGLDVLENKKSLCDKVIIAIDNKKTSTDIKEYLLGLGFQLKQIIYNIKDDKIKYLEEK